MATKKKESFVIYEKWVDILEDLDPSDGIKLIRAICDYSVNHIEPQLKGELKRLFMSFQGQLDANNDRYENGCKGGAPKGSRNNPNGRRGNKELTITNHNLPQLTITNQNNKKLTETNHNLPNDNENENENENVNENENENEIEKEKIFNLKEKRQNKKFIPPTKDEVQAYITEKDYQVDAEEFISFYEMKGWIVGKDKMKSWKGAVRYWNSQRKQKQSQSQKPITPNNAKLGKGEYFDLKGRRTYGGGSVNVPLDAPPRPSDRYYWGENSKAWIYSP